MLHCTLVKTASKNPWTIFVYNQLANPSQSILQCACHNHSNTEKNFPCKKADVLQKRTMDRGQSKKIVVWWKAKTRHKATIEKQDLIGFNEKPPYLLASELSISWEVSHGRGYSLNKRFCWILSHSQVFPRVKVSRLESSQWTTRVATPPCRADMSKILKTVEVRWSYITRGQGRMWIIVDKQKTPWSSKKNYQT